MRYSEITEIKKHPLIDDAVWWLTRWVSGSMNDPAWDYPECQVHDLDQAMEIIASQALVKHPGGQLWRFIVTQKALAQRIVKTKVLPPNERSFQSFTTSYDSALQAFDDIHGDIPQGCVLLVVCAQVSPADVLFTVHDLKTIDHAAYSTLLDWHDQNEVFVRGRLPLPLLSAKIVKR